MKHGIIFDLDGTLLDTLPDIYASVNRMLRALSYPERTLEHTLSGIGYGSRRLMEVSLPEGAGDETVDEALDVYRRIYRESFSVDTKPYEGLLDVVRQLKSEGMALAVLSNKPDELTRALIDKWYAGIFDFVLGQGKYSVKPAPEAPRAVAKALGVAPESIIFIGDSDVDVMTAHGVGAACVGVTWGYRPREVLAGAGADMIAESPQELLAAIKEIHEGREQK